MRFSGFLASLRYLRLGFLLLILLALAAQAQTYIFGRADFPGGEGPIAIAMGDFNGDGISDLAVVDETQNGVLILLGKPDGTFAQLFGYNTGVGPLAIVAGDFNGDGNLDLAVTNGNCTLQIPPLPPNCTGSTVSILLGNGDGTFQPHVDYATGNHPSSIAAADFRGDGKLDLAITSTQGDGVVVLLGNGDGTFQAPVGYAASSPQTVTADCLVVADFNGDGKLDLAVAGSEVSVLLGNGNGTFQPPLNSPGSAPLAAADFNGDGKLDLFAGGDVLLGNGDGTFTLYATYQSGAAAAAADLNGDGKPDLVVAQGGGAGNLSSSSVAILLGNGDGTFQSPTLYGTAIYPSYVLIADFNGDGRFDLAVADPGCPLLDCFADGTVSILLGFGDGTFVGGTDYVFQGNPSQVISADFNGDGKSDIAAAALGTGPFGVYLGNGDGAFQPEIETSLTQPALGFAAGDLNGDGKADLTVIYSNCTNGNCLPGDAVVFISNGDGTFQPPAEYAVGLQSTHVSPNVAMGDFNGDGKPDLAVTNLGANTVSILLNDGGGTFQPHVDYPAGTGPAYIVTGDFNGDGILDLAILDSNGIFLLLGNGNGTFNQGTQAYTLLGYAMVAGDFNRDGKLDLAVTSGEEQTEGAIFILLGNGDGTFQEAVGYPDGQEYGLPSVGDLNGDGNLDLIVGGYVASILLGNGDGSFQAPTFNFLSDGSDIAVADFNLDGAPDLAGGKQSSAGSSLTVMLSAAFKAISPASLNFGSQGVDTTSAPQTITISNSSNVVFNIASIVASGNFSQTNNCVGSLAIGARCSVNVIFAPATTGLLTGAITITDNTKVSPVAIPLSGTGVNGPFLTPYPSRVNFSPQDQGTSSTPATIMLVNTGNAPLSLSSVSITGADAPDFRQKNACGSALAVGASCSVNVTFTPTAGGSRTASLSITDSAPGSPQSVSLSGTGLGPVANLNPNQLTFASQTVGSTSAAQAVTLTNTGSGPLNITSIAASGDFGETNTCNTSLAPGGNCQISVTFTPKAAGSLLGAVTITDNATGSPQVIALSGTGTIVPDFSIGPASGSSNSATITAGQTASFNLAITPAGSFSGMVNLNCAITPAVTPAPVCTVPASVNVTEGTAVAVTAKIYTTAAAATAGTVSQAKLPPGTMAITWATVLLASGLLFAGYRRRVPVLGIPMIAVVLLGMPACGGSSSSPTTMPGTPAGTYTATVTGTSSAAKLTNKTNLTLVVQ
ncbi:MAG TPA: FG-GAP-like repeat-containing protein [Terriglobales bacterium]|nr:FG-GAP-like repeat-containing protein [Terriglobales bacterium]